MARPTERKRATRRRALLEPAELLTPPILRRHRARDKDGCRGEALDPGKRPGEQRESRDDEQDAEHENQVHGSRIGRRAVRVEWVFPG
jgi:hypothetical protein